MLGDIRMVSVWSIRLLYFLFAGSWCYGQNRPEDTIRVQLDTIEVARELPGARFASRGFSSHDIQTAPGSLGDPMRVLAASADVISNADFQAIPIVSGDEPDGILTLLDGFEIAFPYRLMGGFSLFNPLTTKAIDLQTNGYAVSFGGHAPTAISIRSASEYDSHIKTQADLSLPISSLSLHVPFFDTMQCSATLAVRSSHVSVAAKFLSPSDQNRLESFLPNLKDGQLFLRELLSDHLFAFQECLISEERGNLNSLERSFDYSWSKGFVGAGFMTSSDAVSSEHRVSWSRDVVSLATAIPIDYYGSQQFAIDCKFTLLRWKSEMQLRPLPALEFTDGVEVQYSTSEIRFRTFSLWLNRKSPLQSECIDAVFFSDGRLYVTENSSLSAGFRVTRFGSLHQWGFEPRGTIDISIIPRTRIQLSAGQYLQAPSDYQILHGFLTFLAMPSQTPRMMLMSEHSATLEPQRHTLVALDAVTSIVRTPQLTIDVRFNGYYKDTRSLILPARYPNVFTPLDTLSFEPLQCFEAEKAGAGVTSVVGIPTSDLSMTLSIFTHKSIVVDSRTEKEYRTVGDIPLSAKISVQMTPASWTIQLLYQYAAGMPTTDQYFLRSQNLFGTVFYIPIWKELNTSRVPDYHRLDLNIEKTWSREQWTITVVLGALNILGNQNISNYSYTFSDQNEQFVIKTPVVNTLPFVPNVGLKCTYVW